MYTADSQASLINFMILESRLSSKNFWKRCKLKYPRFVIEAIVCLPKDDSAGMLSFLKELKVGRDIPWFLTALNVAGSCRLFIE